MDTGHWSIDLPFDTTAIGFVYKITHKQSGHYYYGQKLLFKKIRRKPLKGKKRIRIDCGDSDWRQYFGSGIVSDHAREHPYQYKFQILSWESSKTDLNLKEANYILQNLNDEYCLNQCFNFRMRIRKPIPSFLQ